MRQADLRAGTRQAAEAHPSPRGHRREARPARAQQTDGDGGGRLYHQAMGPYPADIVRELQPTHAVTSARPRPEAKRVWASLAQPPAEVIDQAFEEAERRDPPAHEAVGGACRWQPDAIVLAVCRSRGVMG